MKTQRKKGFTMVELVIVIAVIAILAAVLIPTFVNLTKKANEAAALADARNIANQILADMLKGGGKDILVFEQKGDELYIHGYCAEAGRVLAYYGNPVKVEGDGTLADKVAAQLNTMVANGEVVPVEKPEPGVWWHADEMAKATVELGYSAETTVLRADYKIMPVTFVKDEVPEEHNCSADTLTHYEGQKPNCTQAGYEEYWICNKCGKMYEDASATTVLERVNVENPTGHAYVNGVCSVCGAKEPSNGGNGGGYEKCFHTWDAGSVEKAATCGDTGVRILTCTKCQTQTKEVIPATGNHTEVIDAAVPATCTTDGKTEGKHCSVCDKVLVAQEIVQATGHHTPGEGDKCTSCGVTLNNSDRDANATVVTDFTTLKNELEKSDGGSLTIRLGANIAMPKDGCITQNEGLVATLDLNGYTLTLYNSSYDSTTGTYGTTGFFVRGAMAIKDTSLAKCGKITAASTDNNGEGGLITVEKTDKTTYFGGSNVQFAVESGTIDTTNNEKGCAILMWHSARVLINGGTVKAKSYAISGSKDDGTMVQGRLIINGGEITSLNTYAIYHPQYIAKKDDAIFEINGGTITGTAGVIKMGGANPSSASSCTRQQLDIRGGILISGSDHIIFIDVTHTKGRSDDHRAQVKVSGGQFTITNANTGAFIKATFGEEGQIRQCYCQGGTFKNIGKDKFVVCDTGKVYAKITDRNWLKSGCKATEPDANGVWSVVPKN